MLVDTKWEERLQQELEKPPEYTEPEWKQILRKARALIANPDNWCKGSFHKVERRHVVVGDLSAVALFDPRPRMPSTVTYEIKEHHRYCAVGAVREAAGLGSEMEGFCPDKAQPYVQALRKLTEVIYAASTVVDAVDQKVVCLIPQSEWPKTIPFFNDHNSHSSVLAAFDRALTN